MRCFGHEFEEGVKSTVDELKEIHFGTTDDPRPIYISALLTPKDESAYVELLHEYKDAFAWTYKEMPGLDPKVAVHHLAIKRGSLPVKQSQRRFRPDLIPLTDHTLIIKRVIWTISYKRKVRG